MAGGAAAAAAAAATHPAVDRADEAALQGRAPPGLPGASSSHDCSAGHYLSLSKLLPLQNASSLYSYYLSPPPDALGSESNFQCIQSDAQALCVRASSPLNQIYFNRSRYALLEVTVVIVQTALQAGAPRPRLMRASGRAAGRPHRRRHGWR